MKRLPIILGTMILALGISAQNIMMSPAKRGISKSNDQFSKFEATFSFNEIESVEITGTERGTFSVITIDGAYIDGEYGMPGLPVFKRMISVPENATPKVVVKSYSTNDYSLEEYGINTIFPRQPDVRKDWDPSTITFKYDEKAYSNFNFNNSNIADIEVIGKMRGLNIGMIVIRPVQYNPGDKTIRVYNDIEIEVIFENGDEKRTNEILKNTFSPYFANHYKSMFNSGVIRGVYEDNPDLYSTPVHMLVIANRMFETTLQPWIEWKTKKGFYMDVNYTDVIGTTAAAIKTFCHNKYNQGSSNGTAPTFIVIVGDVQQVPTFQSINSNVNFVSDHQYANVTAGYIPDMYVSRMSAQTTQQLQNIIEKTLYYEKYQFADPTYLDNVLLIAGADGIWNPRVGQQQINYASTHYYNAAHGYANVHKFLTSYTNCYTHLNNVGFANFTAHCGETSWSQPDLTISMVNALTNVNKYFIAMGNCCLAADFGTGECMGEAQIRAPQKGAVGYIGSAPSSYWYDDFHFAVGAYLDPMGGVTNPTLANTKDGCYDMMFRDEDFNCLNSHIFGGNLAVTYAHVNGLPVHTGGNIGGPWYYWQAYNILGDGSLMPYNGQAAVNDVSHLPYVPIGVDTYEVLAVPGSYVAISKGGVLIGVAVADAAGVALVTLNPPITSGGDVDIVVTRNQYKPYQVQLSAIALEGPYIVHASNAVQGGGVLTYTSTNKTVEVTLKNVGADPTTGPVTVEFSCTDPQITINTATVQHTGTIAPGSTATVNCNVTIANDIVDKKTFSVMVKVTGSAIWESRMTLTAYAPKLALDKVLINGIENGNLTKGEVIRITAVVENKGGAEAFNLIGELEINSEFVRPACDVTERNRQNLPAGEKINLEYFVVTDINMPFGHTANFDLLLSAQYNISGTLPFTASYSGSSNYCVPGTTNCNSNDRFTLVKLYKQSTPNNPMINHNPPCGNNGYTDYTSIVCELEPGAQYKLDISVSNGGLQYICGWIDYNQNNTFDSNEAVVNNQSCASGGSASFTFTTPEDILPGETRFRLRCKYNSAMNDACESFSYGQTLDYKIVFPEIYPRVKNVEAELIGSSIKVTWEAPEDNTYTPVGYNVYRNGNVINTSIITQTTFTENNLEQGVYVYYVTAVYAGNKESFMQMSNVICFDVACDVPVILSVEVEEKTVIITWGNTDNIEGLLGYNIYRDGEKINEVLIQEQTYSDGPLAVGTYYYQVSASYELCEESSRSTGEEAVVLPILCESPANLTGEVINKNTAFLTWSEPENIDGILTGYNIYCNDAPIGQNLSPSKKEFSDNNLPPGVYTYKVSAIYEHCQESDKPETTVIITVGISDNSVSAFNIYPNPATGEVTFKGDGLNRVEIFDLQGRKLSEYNNLNGTLKIDDLNDFGSSIYIIKMYSDTNQTVIQRLTIVK